MDTNIRGKSPAHRARNSTDGSCVAENGLKTINGVDLESPSKFIAKRAPPFGNSPSPFNSYLDVCPTKYRKPALRALAVKVADNDGKDNFRSENYFLGTNPSPSGSPNDSLEGSNNSSCDYSDNDDTLVPSPPEQQDVTPPVENKKQKPPVERFKDVVFGFITVCLFYGLIKYLFF